MVVFVTFLIMHLIITTVTTATASANDQQSQAQKPSSLLRYNILSLDSARYKGYLTASFLEHIEQQSYNIAVDYQCIKEKRASEKIAMPELFDMITGSETGAIIATSLVIPNDDPSTNKTQDNKFFSEKTKDFFERNVDTLYHDIHMPLALKMVIYLFIVVMMCFFTYWRVYWYFYIEGFNERFMQIKDLIKMRKRQLKQEIKLQRVTDYQSYIQIKSGLYNFTDWYYTGVEKNSKLSQVSDDNKPFENINAVLEKVEEYYHPKEGVEGSKRDIKVHRGPAVYYNKEGKTHVKILEDFDSGIDFYYNDPEIKQKNQDYDAKIFVYNNQLYKSDGSKTKIPICEQKAKKDQRLNYMDKKSYGEKLEIIIQYEEQLEKLLKRQNKFLGYNLYAVIVMFILSSLLVTEAIIPFANKLFLEPTDSQMLRHALINQNFIPYDMNITDIQSVDDFMITAWDLTNAKPIYFSKLLQSKENVENQQKHTLGDMTFASATTPYYFSAAKIGDTMYISGDQVAVSPAMSAHYTIHNRKDQKALEIIEKKLRIVSVGATNEKSEKIDVKQNLQRWAYKLTSLNAAVKKHTQDYLTEYLLRENNHHIHKYELTTTLLQEQDLYLRGRRLATLRKMASDMIEENDERLIEVLKDIVIEKICKKDSTAQVKEEFETKLEERKQAEIKRKQEEER